MTINNILFNGIKSSNIDISTPSIDYTYEKKANKLVENINSTHTIGSEKLRMVFDYFTSPSMSLDLSKCMIQYKDNVEEYKSTKLLPLLSNVGDSLGFALVFKDIAERLGIPCRVVSGLIPEEHYWNVVYISGELKQIDIGCALLDDKWYSRHKYFLKSLDALGDRLFNEDLTEIENSILTQYKMIEERRQKILGQYVTQNMFSRRDNILTYPDGGSTGLVIKKSLNLTFSRFYGII